MNKRTRNALVSKLTSKQRFSLRHDVMSLISLHASTNKMSVCTVKIILFLLILVLFSCKPVSLHDLKFGRSGFALTLLFYFCTGPDGLPHPTCRLHWCFRCPPVRLSSAPLVKAYSGHGSHLIAIYFAN